MNVYMSAQSYQLDTESNKVMLAINYLTDKIADWIQSYINRKFHSESSKNEEKKIFNNYDIYLFIYLILKWLSNHADFLLNLHDEKNLSA